MKYKALLNNFTSIFTLGLATLLTLYGLNVFAGILESSGGLKQP